MFFYSDYFAGNHDCERPKNPRLSSDPLTISLFSFSSNEMVQ